ncbi:MAG TPA: HD domain-containing phosphohydrolase [Gemmatimonadaceae bacterium]|nr:HD domain-containing phosphohydrolase [Gemmatimonadaceae bacterium]
MSTSDVPTLAPSRPTRATPRSAAVAPSHRVPAFANARVLIIDDEETIRLALAKFLRARGYDVRTAGSAADGLAVLAEERFEVVLCDVRMPGMSGLELVPHALAVDADLAVMMLTAVNDAPTATAALSSGAMDYLVKPIELAELQGAVDRVLRRRAEAIERKTLDRRIREEVAARTAELEREKAALKALTVNVVETLINAQEAKDVHLRGHSQRVADLGASVAHELGLDEDTVEDIRLAGRLHDVGKIGVREEVLNKPARLTPEEYAHVKEHVRIGVEILAPLRAIIGPALQYVQDHHEQWGGGGYPRGLAGEAISLGGRVLCACDAFDALTSKRAYREPLTQEAALAFLKQERGTLADARVVDALHAVIERQQALVFIDVHD